MAHDGAKEITFQGLYFEPSILDVLKILMMEIRRSQDIYFFATIFSNKFPQERDQFVWSDLEGILVGKPKI
jgi:hypothetical protein